MFDVPMCRWSRLHARTTMTSSIYQPAATSNPCKPALGPVGAVPDLHPFPVSSSVVPKHRRPDPSLYGINANINTNNYNFYTCLHPGPGSHHHPPIAVPKSSPYNVSTYWLYSLASPGAASSPQTSSLGSQEKAGKLFAVVQDMAHGEKMIGQTKAKSAASSEARARARSQGIIDPV